MPEKETALHAIPETCVNKIATLSCCVTQNSFKRIISILN